MGRPPLDIQGKRFGRLLVQKRAPYNGKSASWICLCDCGKHPTIAASSLAGGLTRSCGCLRRELLTKHDMSRSRTYAIWRGMHDRCYGKANKYHGARGIKVCRHWHKFENFLEDMGPRPSGMTIERKDNNGNYSKSNCKWATPLEQQNNTRINVNVTFRGKTQSLSMWSRELGIHRETLQYRHKKGIPLDQEIR